jgi:hypothetical protein
MKSKMTQLLMLFLMISLFSSSKENNQDAKINCKLKCITEGGTTLQGGGQVEIAKEETEEYPFALAPGNYMFHY